MCESEEVIFQGNEVKFKSSDFLFLVIADNCSERRYMLGRVKKFEKKKFLRQSRVN